MTLAKSVKFVPTEKKALIPAFENVKIDIVGDVATFTSCNGNAQLIVKCSCKSAEDFSFCISAKLFLKTVSYLSENNVNITIKDENKAQITSGKSRSTISLDCAPKDYQLMSHGNLTSELNINEFYLKKAFKSANKFADDSGTNVSCINLNLVDNKIVFTSRTKAQLVRIAITPISIVSWSSISIYPEVADTLCSMLGDNGEVTVSHCGDKIAFFRNSEDVHNDFSVTATTPTAKYPDTEALIKSAVCSTKILVNTVEFRAAVKRLQLYVDIARIISIELMPSGEVSMRAENSLVSSSCEEDITCLSKVGTHNLKKNFNVEFIIQILSEIEENECWISFDEDTKFPTYIIPHEALDKNAEFLFLTKEVF